ncbi:hypothetical protein F511_32699 [Dorcoceras hygrometricum]|uniref:Uncharacterized protein n=1 Tax=Dorcoceras hygrometricum TaxID=472368 RepID=A0A2Z7BY73_9LAMI|nr:hypothetical protein F511_32699 [Dorcoceras hygrometricum]
MLSKFPLASRAPDLIPLILHCQLAMVFDGETIDRLTRAHMEVASSRQSLDEVLEHHTKLAKQLEELQMIRDEERRASKAEQKAV